jgi:hypothetical protein
MAKAKKKTVASKAVVRTPVAPATPTKAAPGKAVVAGSWRERAAKSVQESKAVSALIPAQTGSFISFRNGVPTLGGVKLPNPIPVVILAYGFERSYYSGPYKPDVQAVPECYSYDNERPHEKAKVPQNDNCATCRFNEFKTARDGGNGKACKEGARFVAISADALDSVENIIRATIVQGKLSTLNAKGFRTYVQQFETNGTAIWQGITELSVEPDERSQYAVTYSAQEVELSEEQLDALSSRVDEAITLMAQPYPDLTAAPEKAPARTAARRKF